MDRKEFIMGMGAALSATALGTGETGGRRLLKVTRQAPVIGCENMTGRSARGTRAKVYFSRTITAESLIALYDRISESIHGKVGVKLHTGERHGPNIIPRPWVRELLEKELPDAFLRRCIFHYIAFPNEEMMQKIVMAHYPDIKQNLMDNAIRAFYRLRSLAGINKKPATSELLDWIRALQIGGITEDDMKQVLPYIGVLLKKTEDLQLAAKEHLY